MNKSWAKVTFREIINIKHGYPFKGEYFSEEGRYIVLTPGNFYEEGGFKRQAGKEKYYLGEIPNEYFHKQGDLIVAMTEQAEGLLGSCAIVPEDDLYLHNQRLGLITVYDEKIDKMFIYYLFQLKYIRTQISLTSTGTKVKHTSPERIYDVNCFLPSFLEQQKIASILSILDKKIALNNKINQELEAMAKTLYDYWFVQFDFPDAEGKPYKSTGGKMVYSEELKREIPKGWEVVTISDILPVITGKEDANFAIENGKYPFFTCSEKVISCDIPAFEGKAILVAGNGNMNVKFYEGKFNAYQRTYVLIPDDKKYYSLLYFIVRDQISALSNGSRGSIIKFITKGDLERIPLIVPKNGYKNLFTQLNEIIKLVENNKKETQKLTQLRDWLLPMLMNGQVKVGEHASETEELMVAEPVMSYGES